jgi:hypothetical protein
VKNGSLEGDGRFAADSVDSVDLAARVESSPAEATTREAEKDGAGSLRSHVAANAVTRQADSVVPTTNELTASTALTALEGQQEFHGGQPETTAVQKKVLCGSTAAKRYKARFNRICR